MLKNVKAMILQKNEFLEAAQILFEESTESNIDDLIILGESAHDLPEDEEEEDEGKEEKEEEEEDDEPEDKESDEEDDGGDLGGDLDNLPLDSGDKPKGPEEDEDLLNSSMDDDGIQPSMLDTDDLPAVVDNATGSPAGDDSEDFLNITIDLRSNTISDILPVPPSNAGEAIASDDILNTRVDSGFAEDAAGAAAGFPMEEEAEDDILKESIDDEADEKKAKADQKKEAKEDALKESTDSFLEAISLGDPEPEAEAAPAEEAAPEAAPEAAAEEAPPEEGGESEVTSAVRDKVSEADEPIEGGEPVVNSKEELLKKLGSITKSLEDAKKAVMNTLQ